MSLNEQNTKLLSHYGITKNFITNFEKKIAKYISENINNTKKITEPVLIFSDVHANLPALKMTLEFAQKNNINNFISLGDLIEYNYFNKEILDLIIENKSKFISLVKGNHDEIQFSENPKSFVSPFFNIPLEKHHGEFLITLLEFDIIQINKKKFLLTHANPWNVDIIYIFPDDINLMEYFINLIRIDGFMFGHTHHLTFYESNNKFGFNPGSLGVSRDGQPRLTFSVLNPENETISIYEIEHKESDFTNLISEEPKKIDEFSF